MMDGMFAESQPLRVAVVHSFYSSRQASGENRVVQQQVETLRHRGWPVELFAQHTDLRERRRSYPLEAAATVATGRGPTPLRELRRFRPDVVYVHNLFPNYGRHWVRHWHGPIVAVMHNYRPMCAAATFYRDGHGCTDCLDALSARPAVRHACYRDSTLATLPVAAGVRFGADPLLRRADRVVVLNHKMRRLYERAGVDAGKMRVIPNYMPPAETPGKGAGPWLYVGRLTHDKGILQLLEEWPAGRRLLVAGSGELEDQVRDAAPSGVEVLGAQSPERTQQLIGEAIGLVFPSRTLEGLPSVYVEALRAGTPVLTWPQSVVADLVEREATGMVVDEPLPGVLDEAERRFPGMRQHCLTAFDARYTEDQWLDRIGQLFDEVTV